MFRDPVVTWMSLAALGLVILFLATVVGAMLTGVVRSESPRTAGERDLIIAASSLGSGNGTGGEWVPYINALLQNGDVSKARIALESAKASVNGTATAPELVLVEAKVDLADKEYAQAVKVADAAMKAFVAKQQARSKAGSETVSVGGDYYNASLVKAYGYVGLSQWKNAVAAFDVYLRTNSTAADILIDRGNAKASMKDNAGAEKDFRAALRFVPDDQEALAGLKRIGASK